MYDDKFYEILKLTHIIPGFEEESNEVTVELASLSVTNCTGNFFTQRKVANNHCNSGQG